MDFYIKNMECMKEHKPELFKAIEKSKTQPDSRLESIDSVLTKDGNKGIVIRYKSKEYRLNSSYRPAEEAKRWAKAYEITGTNTVVNMFGLGNGVFAQAILDKMDATSYLLIYEPSYDIFEHTLKNYDITDIISNKNVLIFIEGINSEDFRSASNSYTNITNLNSQIQCVHPRYDEIFVESAVKFYKDLKDSYTSEVINTNTIIKLAKRNIDNLFSNMSYLRESSSLGEVKEMIPGDIPAIIVAAGPSVEESIEELKRAKGKAVIFAVDSILKYLLNSGVEPDFVVSIDPNKSKRHFTMGIPVTTPLITYMESNHDLLELHQGKKIFCSHNSFVNEMYKKVNKTPPYISPSGSVAIVAFSICISLGFSEIILVGQDLAYKDNRTHAGSEKNVQFNPVTDVMLEGVNGEQVRSRYDWHEFVMRYEELIKKNPNVTIIDAKRNGAKIKGAQVMDLGQAIDIYCNKYTDFKFANEDIKNTFSDKEFIEVKNYLQSNLVTLRTIKEKINKSIKDCDILIEENKRNDSKRFNDAMKRIKKANKYIEDQEIYSIMDNYIIALATTEMTRIYKVYDDIEESNLNTFKQSKAIYEAAIKAVDYVYPKLEDIISKL